MGRIYLRTLRNFVASDGTVRCPRELVVGFDPEWNAFYAQVYLGADGNPPDVWIGRHGHDGAQTVEGLAEALRPIAHLPKWARADLIEDRESTDEGTRAEADARREAVVSEGNKGSPRVQILHPVEEYLDVTDARVGHGSFLNPIGPVVVERPVQCELCDRRLRVGQALYLYARGDVFMCVQCAYPGLCTSKRKRKCRKLDLDLLDSAASGSLEGVWRALSEGAYVDASHDGGCSALYHACANSDDRMACGLLAAGASPDGATARFAPLAAAAHCGNVALAIVLLGLWAPVDAAHGELTPLLCAAQAEEPRLVRVLLGHGADPNRRSLDGKTPIVGAIENLSTMTRENAIEIVAELIAAGARLDVADNAGNTPLHLAAATGDLTLVEYLLVHGADPNRHNAAYETPLHVAMRMGHDETAAWLRAYAPQWIS